MSLGFLSPPVLFALVLLPLIWWLLRLTPPRPQSEVFAPLYILLSIVKREDTPHKSPWWLTLLRLLLSTAVILALAGPVLNPRTVQFEGEAPLALVVDNGWASAANWADRASVARRLIEEASEAGMPVALLFTTDDEQVEVGPFEAQEALDRLAAALPQPVPVSRELTATRLGKIEALQSGFVLAYLSDGLASEEDSALENLGRNARTVLWVQDEQTALTGLVDVENGSSGMDVALVRSNDGSADDVRVQAFDDRGRQIAETVAQFEAGKTTATASFRDPTELRNDFAVLRVDGQGQAGATRLIDAGAQRRRVAIVSEGGDNAAQPLLSSSYYVRRALAPFADVIEPSKAELSEAVDELLEQRPSVIVMTDIGVLSEDVTTSLTKWVEEGGTLVRFAGPRLAQADITDELLPVDLSRGTRALGGTMSWAQPQPLTQFDPDGPLAGLPVPQNVLVDRQVLAEPSLELSNRAWARLGDGTPLITGRSEGQGWLVLFHTSSEAGWSNLPISGTFVEILQRLVRLSQGTLAPNDGEKRVLAPYRLLDGEGRLGVPSDRAQPLELGKAQPAISLIHPPGFYGSENGYQAINLLSRDDKLDVLLPPEIGTEFIRQNYQIEPVLSLRGWLFLLALLLLIADSLAMIWLRGGLVALGSSLRTKAALSVMLAFCVVVSGPELVQAQKSDQSVADILSQTRLAYVITGVKATDEISNAGMDGLGRFLAAKTAFVPGDPVGVNLERDELSLYPLIYWPVEASAPLPSREAIDRVDAYMKNGGTVLFDTKDQLFSGFANSGNSPANQRLRTILSGLNIPPLEAVPLDHVLTKSFYILEDFPGRFSGGDLWVEASFTAESAAERPVRTGDGVTPLMITSNDFAGAWAVAADGRYLQPTVPSDPAQRVYAFRTGVNIVMYMLTGNYKSDQVHVPALLERLGQ